ncbi:hypothetical protein GCM10020219_020350 [Nonomuraea dietziae]
MRRRSADVVLLDTTSSGGGIRPCIKAAGVCETFQLGVAVHSSGELGIQLATMLHLGRGAAQPHLRRRRPLPPAGADDVIVGGSWPTTKDASPYPKGRGSGCGAGQGAVWPATPSSTRSSAATPTTATLAGARAGNAQVPNDALADPYAAP